MKKIYSKKLKPKEIRLYIYRSNNNIYIQIIDDNTSKVLKTYSTLNIPITFYKFYSIYNFSRLLGKKLAKYCLKKNIHKIIFDRNSYSYHGNIKILANEIRLRGLIF
uniref:Ribosomal protein L18 n=1 Tax=Nitzschia sp. NIES-3576 TaxID=2083273 RepID=A0A2Z5ZBA5_9STRA|nr:ribosomal protein L18 [Nitzschia sp. NIES-3576]